MQRINQENTGCEFDPTFSSDGRQLAYMKAPRPGEHAALMIASADGNSARTLVSNEEDNLKPVFVPHSSRMLFLRSRAFEHYSPLVDNARHKFDVYSVDLASGKITPLTDKKFYEISHISVAHDGKQAIITVSSQGDKFLVLPLGGDSPQSTTELQPIVPGGPRSGPVIYNAEWLPDGKSLLFTAATERPGGSNFNYNVYRLTLASGDIEKLTDLTGLIYGLSVSADGKRAVIRHNRDYLILDLATRELARVPLRWE